MRMLIYVTFILTVGAMALLAMGQENRSRKCITGGVILVVIVIGLIIHGIQYDNVPPSTVITERNEIIPGVTITKETNKYKGFAAAYGRREIIEYYLAVDMHGRTKISAEDANRLMWERQHKRK